MPYTNQAGRSLTAFTGKATSFSGKGLLKALGFSNPLSAGITIGLTITEVLISIFKKPKPKPPPVKSIDLTGGRPEARDLVGETSVKIEPTDHTTLPGRQYKDNHLRVIACLSEGPCGGIGDRIWLDEEEFGFRFQTPNHIVPRFGSRYVLKPSEVRRYNWAQSNAIEIRQKLLADGTENASALTTGNSRWVDPRLIEYDGHPNNTWGSTFISGVTEKYRIPIPDDPPDNMFERYELDETVVPPVYRSLSDPTDTMPVTYDQGKILGPYEVETLVKTIDSTYKLNGITWLQFDWFNNFAQDTNTERAREDPETTKHIFEKLPTVRALFKGRLLKVPGQTEPIYTNNPAAVLYFIDTVYFGIPESEINQQSFQEAYNDCEQVINYRYGNSPPNPADGEDGEFYIWSDLRIYRKQNGTWDDIAPVQGDYSWITSKGTNGVYSMKRYSCNLEIVRGDNMDDVYAKVLVCCDGTRFQGSDGLIHYRVGKDRVSSLTVDEEDIIETAEVQTWIPHELRVNKFIAKLSQSEQNDYLPDTVPYEDTRAITRDGGEFTKEFVLEGVTNPLQAANLTHVILAKMQLHRVWPLIIAPMDDMVQLNIKPYDVITVTNKEYRLQNKDVMVINVEYLPSGSVALRVQDYRHDLYDAIFALPPIREKPFRYETSSTPIEVTGLRAYDTIEERKDSNRINTHVTWDNVVTASTEVQQQIIGEGIPGKIPRGILRLIGHDLVHTAQNRVSIPSGTLRLIGNDLRTVSFFGSYLPPGTLRLIGNGIQWGSGFDIFDDNIQESETRGILFKVKDRAILYGNANARGFTPQESSNDYNPGNSGGNTGYYLWSNLIESQGIANNPTQKILGTNSKIQRLGYNLIVSSSLNRSIFNIDLAKFDSSSPQSESLTQTQAEEFRFMLQDSAGNEITLAIRAPDRMSEPYGWPIENMNPYILQFFQNAYRANPKRTVNFAIVRANPRLIDPRFQLTKYGEVNLDVGTLRLIGHDLIAARQDQDLSFWSNVFQPSESNGVLFRDENKNWTASRLYGLLGGASFRAPSRLLGIRSGSASGSTTTAYPYEIRQTFNYQIITIRLSGSRLSVTNAGTYYLKSGLQLVMVLQSRSNRRNFYKTSGNWTRQSDGSYQNSGNNTLSAWLNQNPNFNIAFVDSSVSGIDLTNYTVRI